MKLSSSGATPPLRLWNSVTWLLNHLAGSGRRLLHAEIGGASERNAYGVLSGLLELAPINQADLSKSTGFDKGDLARVLEIFESRGLIERNSNPDDRRNKIIVLTNSGKKELYRLDPMVGDAQEALLKPLSPDERAQLVDMLQRLLVYHESYSPIGTDKT